MLNIIPDKTKVAKIYCFLLLIFLPIKPGKSIPTKLHITDGIENKICLDGDKKIYVTTYMILAEIIFLKNDKKFPNIIISKGLFFPRYLKPSNIFGESTGCGLILSFIVNPPNIIEIAPNMESIIAVPR